MRPTLPTTGVDLAAQALRYAHHPDDWPFAPRFDPVQRWYARLAVAADHEVWLLTWLPGQSTDLHDHGGSAGAFAVLSGVLTEHTVVPGARPALVPAPQPGGAVRAFGPRHVHRIVNAGDRPAVSVHAYAPALRSMTRYRLDGSGLRVVAEERAGEDW
jgi:predicted metal-dependent enzyme (double-stranded beta helix superfamily)